MATAKDIVDLAASFVGVKENPPDSNNVIFNTSRCGGARAVLSANESQGDGQPAPGAL